MSCSFDAEQMWTKILNLSQLLLPRPAEQLEEHGGVFTTANDLPCDWKKHL